MGLIIGRKNFNNKGQFQMRADHSERRGADACSRILKIIAAHQQNPAVISTATAAIRVNFEHQVPRGKAALSKDPSND
jgi:hypothetical protein